MKIKYLIDTLLTPSITAIPWIDRYAGIVQTMYRQERGKGESFVTKRFPVACDATEKDCDNLAIQQDLAPNDNYDSVVYWEELTPMTNTGQTKTKRFNEKRFKGTARLVVWINRAKLGLDECDSLAAAVLQLENVISKRLKISGGDFDGSQLKIEPKGMVKHDINTIFGKYDYKIEKNWYLYPFDYFAIDFTFTVDQCLKNTTTLLTGAREDCPNDTDPLPCFSFLFDGVSEAIDCTNNAAFNQDFNTPFSGSAYVKASSFSTLDFIISKILVPIGWHFSIRTQKLRLIAASAAGGGNNMVADGTTVLNTGQWYHIAFTYNGSNDFNGIKLFVDGVQETISSGAGIGVPGSFQSAQPLQIGGQGSFFFNGNIVSPRVWNIELTPTEVLQDKNTLIGGIPVQSSNVIVNADIQNSTFATDWIITDLTGITAGYTSVLMEIGDKVIDCPIIP